MSRITRGIVEDAHFVKGIMDAKSAVDVVHVRFTDQNGESQLGQTTELADVFTPGQAVRVTYRPANDSDDRPQVLLIKKMKHVRALIDSLTHP